MRARRTSLGEGGRSAALTSAGALLELAALPLGHAAPDPEALVVRECVVEAVSTDVAGQADPLRLPGGAALLREERLRVGLGAQRALLPSQLVNFTVQHEQFPHGPRP